MALYFEIIGFIGASMIVAAFMGKRRVSAKPLAIINFVGAGLLGAAMVYKTAWSGVALEAVWMVVAVTDFFAAGKAKKRAPEPELQTDR